MPYEYKRKQDCKQKSGDSGTYVTKKKGAAHQKCWKSEKAFKDSAAARHMSELDEGQPTADMKDAPKADGGPTANPQASPMRSIKPKKESLIRNFVRQILIQEQRDEMLEIMPSDISGMGVFAAMVIPKGTNIGLAQEQKPDGRYHVTDLGHMHNHSYEPSCTNVKTENQRHLYAARDIFPYEEITVDYTRQPDLEQPQSDWK